MKKLTIEAALTLGAAIASAAADSESSRPRGVGPEFAKHYKSPGDFACIHNPSIKLSASQVNDDYCDCPDGSDEPGTSACSFISGLSLIPAGTFPEGANTTVSLPGFYCKNIGHRPSYVPFSNVNDGICDHELCCDGSDEWAGVGGLKCENKCKEIGKEWRKQDEQRKKSQSAANKKRKELIIEAARVRKEVEDRIKTLDTQIQADEIKLDLLEKEFVEIEKSEKGKIIRAPKSGTKTAALAVLAKERIGELRDLAERVRDERDAAMQRIADLEHILTTFKEEYNPNFNDEGVKRAVRSWEDYAAAGNEGLINDELERDTESILATDEANGIKWAEWEAPEEEPDILYSFEAYLPKPVKDWLDRKLKDLRVLLIENGILASPKSDGESKVVTDARSNRDKAKRSLDIDREDLKKHQEDLTKDYGPDDVFRALKGQCVTKDSGEYTYELCWLEKTLQKPRNGGGGTSMGNFVSIDRVTVDEELPANGKGLGSGERVALKYENGQHCWNGPNRSTTVVLACAEENEIWKIVEEEKCVYRMEVGTPAVCTPNVKAGAAAAKEVGKDEL